MGKHLEFLTQRLLEKKEATKKNPLDAPNQGIMSPFWVWASKCQKPQSNVEADPKPQAPKTIDEEINQLLLDNPGISGSTLFNLLKSRGFKIEKEVSAPSTQEADAGSANVAVLRAEESEKGLPLKVRLLESKQSDSGIGFTKFRAVLLQEGMGNFGDSFYYSQKAIESAVPIFEGKKIYADHPTSMDDEIRPERSVRDIIGHFENVSVTQNELGQHQLEADVVTLPDEPYRWARALMRHAVEYSKQFPDKEFVGLSINASGESEEQELEKVLESAPEGAQPKLLKAKENGISTLRVVSQITDAVSCDLVTEAGAGGKVLQLLEQEKTDMGKKKDAHKESSQETDAEKKDQQAPAAEKPADQKAEAAPEEKPHDDAEQDMELIKKALKQHLGGEEEQDESTMEAAMEAYEAYGEMGMKSDEALKAAAQAIKLAKHMASKKPQEAKEGEEKKEECMDKKESHENAENKETESKESNQDQVAKLVGRNALLETELKKYRVAEHLEKILSESKLTRDVTKKFRALVEGCKSTKEVDEKWKFFKEGLESRGSEAEGSEFLFVTTEKTTTTQSKEKSLDFSDCKS